MTTLNVGGFNLNSPNPKIVLRVGVAHTCALTFTHMQSSTTTPTSSSRRCRCRSTASSSCVVPAPWHYSYSLHALLFSSFFHFSPFPLPPYFSLYAYGMPNGEAIDKSRESREFDTCSRKEKRWAVLKARLSPRSAAMGVQEYHMQSPPCCRPSIKWV